jgi:hypothetical protein
VEDSADRDAQEGFIRAVRKEARDQSGEGDRPPPRTEHESAEEGAREARKRLASEDDAE